MKDERNARQRRAAGRGRRPVACILAAVLMVLLAPVFTGTAHAAVDLSRDCSLTITANASGEEDLEALGEANIVLDLYRIGDAEGDTMYDTYHWSAISYFADKGLVLPESTEQDAWKAVTAQAADILLGKPQNVSQWNPAAVPGAVLNALPAERKITGKALGEKIEGLKPGVYLIIPHGSNIEEYAAYNIMADTSESASEGATDDAAQTASQAPTVMLAKASRRTYQFAPEMIALPTKEPLGDTGEINTANPGEWIYDAEAVLKPAQVGRGGDLRIIKDLKDYEFREKTTDGTSRQIRDDATFVFEVSAYENEAKYTELGNAARIYHNYISIVFNEYDKKSALVTDLPVGAYVIVREVYSGKSYAATTGTDKTTTISAEDVVNVEFENEYDGSHGGGGGVTNKFTYKKDQSKWGWEQMTDSSESGTVIQSDASTE